ncbi:helix-turn-helix transcriptional regulator [Sphingosinicella sp. BN140058]|uniref:helix-turn-helix transcriptional regulator n=1 Tax=Sphingosinicella sp. BN140058 TaxID=1892855 RepID=UPI00101123BB|nr:helix-turn-helix transcriptional regulator [Sphingosinicella sp. BN140058]QAY76464.1 XRE family transcriptional regulator [Sphingosinicella sp. BN140058]
MIADRNDEGPLAAPALQRALRRWRTLNRIKQAHAAELLGVAQSTISRWESGRQCFEPSEARKVQALVGTRFSSAADAVLARLIRESGRPIHLVCDTSHRLLACSRVRAAGFGVPDADLIGRSLWRYSTPELIAEEAHLASCGWYDSAAPAPVEFETGDNGVCHVPIRPGRCRWTRMALSDGMPARLVETLS